MDAARILLCVCGTVLFLLSLNGLWSCFGSLSIYFVWIPNEAPIVSWLLVWRCSSIPKTSRDELPPTFFSSLVYFGFTHALFALLFRFLPTKGSFERDELPHSRWMETRNGLPTNCKVRFDLCSMLQYIYCSRKVPRVHHQTKLFPQDFCNHLCVCRDRKVSLAPLYKMSC